MIIRCVLRLGFKFGNLTNLGGDKKDLKAKTKPQIVSCKVAWSFDTYQPMREVSLPDKFSSIESCCMICTRYTFSGKNSMIIECTHTHSTHIYNCLSFVDC